MSRCASDEAETSILIGHVPVIVIAIAIAILAEATLAITFEQLNASKTN